MEPSLRTLLDGVLDYAGMFPPAELPLPAAIENYLDYLHERDAWMLGRFIVPAARLAELTPYHPRLLGLAPRAKFVALGGGGVDRAAQCDALRSDSSAMMRMHQALEGLVPVDVLETRVPAALLADETLLREFAQILAGAPNPVTLYLEAQPEGAQPETSLLRAIESLAKVRDSGLLTRAGFKLRCGGVVAGAFPTVDLVADVIAACRDGQVPLKCTAGLHHPIRRFHESVGTEMHGFINVLAAGVFAHALGTDAKLLTLVLADEEADAFHLEGQALAWRGLRVTSPQIAAARHALMIGFGSCSVEEPREDLHALNWT